MQGCGWDTDPEYLELENFGDCLEIDDHLPGRLRRHFRLWGEHHMDNPKKLSEYELEDVVNDMVFANWSSFQKFDAPEFKYPNIKDIYIKVGVFNKDLPDPKKGQSALAGTLEDKLFAYLASDEQYSAPLERKAGQPAYLRTSIDGSGNTVIYDWMDVNGDWAPYSAIQFDSNQAMPYTWTFELAYRRHDIAWTQACDEWNSRLCVYLCRRSIWGFSHKHVWNPSKENQKNYTREHFVKAPSIRDILPKIKENWPDKMCVAHWRKPRGIYGREIFRDQEPA